MDSAPTIPPTTSVGCPSCHAIVTVVPGWTPLCPKCGYTTIGSTTKMQIDPQPVQSTATANPEPQAEEETQLSEYVRAALRGALEKRLTPRPKSVTFLAIIQIVGACLSGAAALGVGFLFVASAVVANQIPGPMSPAASTALVTLGTVTLGLAGACLFGIILARGLLKGSAWSRTTLLVFASLGVITNIAVALGTTGAAQMIVLASIVTALVVFGILDRVQARKFFGTKRKTPFWPKIE